MRNIRKKKYLIAVMLTLAVAAGLVCEAGADEITVAAAADLTFAFKYVGDQFQKQTGTQVKLSFGSSGNFYSQIQNGAPYDLFFSADMSYATKLQDAGLTEPGSLTEYAIGKIVLWAPGGSKVEVNAGLNALKDPSIYKIAIANPEHAPYGRAAVAAMKHEGVYDAIKDKIVLGENISQTAQFVQSGNADIGIIALSLAMAPAMKDKGKYFEIPADDYPPIEQAAVILKSSHKKELAQKFLAFIKTPEIAAVMKSYGFAIPKDSAPK
ncbi:MAG TPA: molybdate ABC transporter substrate-binding protein [Candidatus Binataceae bacterium]|nr:molybdate ABC transporter substrate-binding protein [Candidatus Binataceae bacterium]